MAGVFLADATHTHLEDFVHVLHAPARKPQSSTLSTSRSRFASPLWCKAGGSVAIRGPAISLSIHCHNFCLFLYFFLAFLFCSATFSGSPLAVLRVGLYFSIFVFFCEPPLRSFQLSRTNVRWTWSRFALPLVLLLIPFRGLCRRCSKPHTACRMPHAAERQIPVQFASFVYTTSPILNLDFCVCAVVGSPPQKNHHKIRWLMQQTLLIRIQIGLLPAINNSNLFAGPSKFCLRP